jgi:hypothetical protein
MLSRFLIEPQSRPRREAFLRRLDYKMFMSNPPPDEFATIFRDFCAQRDLECPDSIVQHTLREHYERAGRKMRRCHPRDVIRVVIDLISYEHRPYELTTELIDRAYRMKFVNKSYNMKNAGPRRYNGQAAVIFRMHCCLPGFDYSSPSRSWF